MVGGGGNLGRIKGHPYISMGVRNYQPVPYIYIYNMHIYYIYIYIYI